MAFLPCFYDKIHPEFQETISTKAIVILAMHVNTHAMEDFTSLF